MLGNFSGIAAPIITGLVVDWSGSFAGAFFVAAALSAIGVLCWIVVVRDIRPVAWSDAAAPALAGAAPLAA